MSADKFINIGNVSIRKSKIVKVRLWENNNPAISLCYDCETLYQEYIEYDSVTDAKNDYSRILRELSED